MCAAIGVDPPQRRIAVEISERLPSFPRFTLRPMGAAVGLVGHGLIGPVEGVVCVAGTEVTRGGKLSLSQLAASAITIANATAPITR